MAVEKEADVAGLAEKADGEAPCADGPCALHLLADVLLALDGEAGLLEEAAVLGREADVGHAALGAGGLQE